MEGRSNRAVGTWYALRPALEYGSGESFDDSVSAGRCQVSAEPGSAGEAHSRRPNGLVRTWTYMPRRLWLSEQHGMSAVIRSIGSRMPSRITRPGGSLSA